MEIKNPDDLEKIRKDIISKFNSEKKSVIIAEGTCGIASGALEVIQSFKKEIEIRNLNDKINLKISGCHGFCAREPLIVIRNNGQEIIYQQIKPDDVREIISETVINNKIIDRLLFRDYYFYDKQTRFLLANNSLIDPLNIQDYIRVGGYSGLVKALKIEPEQIIDEIKKSGLRGRGGAGFPTGRKWESARKAQGDIKYIICNADEGDPGAFMDRSLLEGNPHSVLEGMIIGAYAIGCNQGYIYVRNEYPLAIQHFTRAIEQAKEYGFLGENILESGFSFSLKINRGGGAFVCGESSALRASIEGRIGEPSVKYIHATDKGLWDRPTVLNNVKTWANISLIINKGADWFSSIGTEKSKGTMIFALVGKINNTGLVEVPMGIKLREMIYDIGGGIAGGKKFKAVQTGGPSGGCIPESLLDLPVDYETLTNAGSMMGSGGMIVMDETTCMVDVARYFLNFSQEESCGKCTPCREGIKQMLLILNKIVEGKGQEGDIELLQDMGEIIKETSLCQLGGSAPNPCLTTIRYFRDEYETHIRDKKCPAKVCKGLIKFSILDKCNGCHVCFKNCPVDAISGEPKKLHIIDLDKCIKCGICFDVCKFDAVSVE